MLIAGGNDASGRTATAEMYITEIPFQVFDNNLSLLAVYDTVGSPWAVCITPGTHQYLYTASNPDQTDTTRGDTTGEIYQLELDGTIVGRLGRADNAWGHFRTGITLTAPRKTKSSPLASRTHFR